MGANKGRRAKNLFKSYYVGFDKAVAEQPEIIEKHVFYHPEKGIQKTVYYPGAEKSMATIPEGKEDASYEHLDQSGKRVSTGGSCESRNVVVSQETGAPQVADACVGAQEAEEPLTQQADQTSARANAASAFQRWRQFHLQRTFNQELRRVSEVSRKDEASMAMVEQERAQREKGLAHALAESATLRAQLTAKEQEIQALQSQTPAGDRRAGKAAAVEFEAEPSERRMHRGPDSRTEEELVWIDQPNAQRQNQAFSALTQNLQHLVGEVTNLEHRAGDMVSFSEVYDAFKNVEQDLEVKRKGSLRRPSPSDVRRQSVEFNDYLRRTYRAPSREDDYRDYRRTRPSLYPRRAQESYTSNNLGIFEKVGKAVVWKWRWALAVSKTKTLSRQLKSLKGLYKAQLARNMNSEATSSSASFQNLSFRSSMEKTLMSTLPSYSLLSFVVSIWRAYTSCTKTQKVFLSRLIPIDKLMAAFPLWIEKNGEKQVLVYFFSLWQFVVSRKGGKRPRSSVSPPRRSPRRRNYHNDPGPSIYESFHHCCHPSSGEASRCSPVRLRSPRTPSDAKAWRATTQRPHHRHTTRPPKEPPDDGFEEEKECSKCAANAEASNRAEANSNMNVSTNKAPLDCVSNVEGAPLSSFESLGVNEVSIPNVALTGQTFSAQALRRLQLQLQHELQDMQPILAKATKAIQDQVVVDQSGKCANSMASLWKICSTVEYALTEARNQMLLIIHDSARGYHNGLEFDEQVDRFLPEGVVPFHDVVEVERLENASRKSCGFPNAFSLISKTSGLHSLRRKSCLAAQYAVGLNQKIQQIKEQPTRTWQT